MADEPRQQPVAIRVTRPYASPEEFLEHELETLTRTSITLVGAQPRPKGVILRFEVALTGGKQLLRGEGRVVGFKENVLGDQPGLVLRFTRLDTKSKALVNRAALIREGRARAALQAAMGEDSMPPPSLPPDSLPPTSIGPMSVMQEPPQRVGRERSRPPSHATPVSSRPAQPAPASAPPPVMRQEREPPRAPHRSIGGVAFTAPFSPEDEPTAADTSTSSALFDTSIVPVPAPVNAPPSPAVAPAANPPAFAFDDDAKRTDEATPTAASLDRQAPAAAPRAHEVVPRDTNREPILERLRARAKALSPERVNALTRR